MRRFRRRPEEVEAMRFLGAKNCAEVCKFVGVGFDPDDQRDNEAIALGHDVAVAGDWLVKDAAGAVDVYGPVAFDNTFEQVGSAK